MRSVSFVLAAATTVFVPAIAAVVLPFPAALADPRPSASDPGCAYGKVLDGHTGQVRCISPEEAATVWPRDVARLVDGGADASNAPSGRRPRLRDAGDIDVAVADSAIPLQEVSVTVDAVQFEFGDVPRAQAALERFARREASRCATEHDWRSARRRPDVDAHIDLRFLVRAPGRAEGVDVGGARGLSAGLVQCITSALANRLVGAPSGDPVAVSVRFKFR